MFRILSCNEVARPIEALERYLREGGTSIVQAAFEHSYFAHPDRVRQKTPRFPDRARYSRKHYPGGAKNERAIWQGREVRLDDNSRAQKAWVVAPSSVPRSTLARC